MAKVTIYDGHENELSFPNIKEGQVTLIDSESHGQGPIGRFEDIENGGQRLIISSPGVVAIHLTPDD